jgi:Flp pilus assembly protein TadG
MRNLWTRAPRNQRGAALVELAVALPVMVALVVFTTDFARVFYTAIELTNAARAGAQFGAKDLGSSTTTSAMQTAATNAVNISDVTASASRLCQCVNAAATFTATTPANNCTGAAATACSVWAH